MINRLPRITKTSATALYHTIFIRFCIYTFVLILQTVFILDLEVHSGMTMKNISYYFGIFCVLRLILESKNINESIVRIDITKSSVEKLK